MHRVPCRQNQGQRRPLRYRDGVCMSYREIRVNKDVTRVKLIKATPSALCFTGHADKNPADIQGTVHSPAVRDCLKCHDPHAAENRLWSGSKVDGLQRVTKACLSATQGRTASHTAGLIAACDPCGPADSMALRDSLGADPLARETPPQQSPLSEPWDEARDQYHAPSNSCTGRAKCRFATELLKCFKSRQLYAKGQGWFGRTTGLVVRLPPAPRVFSR